MTLNTYIKRNKIKIAEISRSSGIPYTTLRDVINGNTDIDNTSVKIFIKLSKALGISLEELYKLAKNTSPTPELGNGYQLYIKGGKYYIKKDNASYFLCNNTPVQSRYIKDIANTFIGNIEREKRMKKRQERSCLENIHFVGVI